MSEIVGFDYVEEIKVDNMFRSMNDRERSLMLKKLIGPLLDDEVLTDKESAVYFIYTTRDRTMKGLRPTFKLQDSRIQQIISSAERKIKAKRVE